MPTPALVTRPNVEIMKVGVWEAMTEDGQPWIVTEDDIQDAIAASRDPKFRNAVLKLGHTDERFTSGDGAFGRDATPAVGRLSNYRASADGQTLLVDLVGVPAWLDAVMASAYPSRSTESITGTVPGTDRTYSTVVTGLALLGETAPAIESLADIAALFDVDTDVSSWASARKVCASFSKETEVPTISTTPTRVSGSARIEDLYQAAEAWAKGQDSVPSEAWPREIYTDYLILCDYDGRLWKTTWSETNGEFSFGPAGRVQITYTALAETVAAAAAHAMHSPLRFAAGLDVSARITASQGATSVDITPEMREALGVDENADEAAVLAALQGLKTPAVAPPPPSTETPSGDTPVIPAAQSGHSHVDGDAPTVADLDQRVAAAVSAAMVTASAGQEALRTELTRVSAELATTKQAEATKQRDETIGRAVSAGKIRPADKDRYTALYDAAPAQTVDILDALAPGTAVPISATGYAGGGDGDGDDVDKVVADFAALLNGGTN